MACKRVIACLDLQDGRTVKGVNFQGLKDLGDPAELALMYQDQGADEITVLDVTASSRKRPADTVCVERIARNLSIPLCAGGGVKTLEHARLLLESGADKVSVNSAATGNPDLISEIAMRYGSQCCVLAVDAAWKGSFWTVLTHGGTRDTGMELLTWIRKGVFAGCGEILLTSWNRDGTGQGFDIPLTAAVSNACSVPVVASGGAGKPSDFIDVFLKGNADAALAAGILHRNEFTVKQIKDELEKSGIEVRPC